MKVILLFNCVLIFSIGWLNASAQNSTQQNPYLNKPIDVTGKIIQLDLPINSTALGVIWDNRQGTHYQKIMAHKGTRPYEMRTHPQWRGLAYNVRIRDNLIPHSSIVKPNFADELKIFFAPQQWLQTKTNFTEQMTLFGFKLEHILLFIFLGGGLVLFIWKLGKWSANTAFLLSFLIAWGIMDLREMVNRISVVATLEDNDAMNRWFGYVDQVKQVETQIGAASWNSEGVKWPLFSILRYHLSETPRVKESAEFTVVVENNQLKAIKNQ